MMSEFKSFTHIAAKTMQLAAAAAIGVVAISSAAQAQSSDTATGTATANIVSAIQITAGQDLQFGDIVADTGGTVTVDPTTGNGAVTGAVVLLGNEQQGTFDVTGEANRAYDITLPAGSINLTGPAAATITVDTFTSDPATSGTLSAGGTQTVNVGARATIASGQTVGAYTGTYDVTVTYQ